VCATLDSTNLVSSDVYPSKSERYFIERLLPAAIDQDVNITYRHPRHLSEMAHATRPNAPYSRRENTVVEHTNVSLCDNRSSCNGASVSYRQPMSLL
jgi:hypothetical protein